MYYKGVNFLFRPVTTIACESSSGFLMFNN